jgi:CRP/FNR family transcriptional regulator, anaerobic regulatory protein
MEIIRKYFDQFLPLNDDEWNAFEKCLSKEEVKKKEFLLKEGQVGDFIAFVAEGSLRFYVLREGEEKVIAFFFAGSFVSNYRSFLTNLPSEYYIEVLQDTLIYRIRKNELVNLYDQFPKIERLGRLIAENLYLMVAKRLDSFLFKSPKERYEELLAQNSRLPEEVPQYMIASYLGVKPETLSRIRARK